MLLLFNIKCNYALFSLNLRSSMTVNWLEATDASNITGFHRSVDPIYPQALNQ